MFDLALTCEYLKNWDEIADTWKFDPTLKTKFVYSFRFLSVQRNVDSSFYWYFMPDFFNELAAMSMLLITESAEKFEA